MPIMNDQYHQLEENGAASHQSIVHNQSVAESNIQVAIIWHLSNLKANELLKEEPNHDSIITTA